MGFDSTFIREHKEDIIDNIGLQALFNWGVFDKDFIRQLISLKGEEAAKAFELEILVQGAQIEATLNNSGITKHLFIIPGDTINILVNTITYIKYCKIHYKKLKNKLHLFEQYLEHYDEYHVIDTKHLKLNLPEVYDLVDENGKIIQETVI